MKILIVSQIFDKGYIRGAERVAMNTAAWLRKNHQVEILSLGEKDGQDNVDGFTVNRVRFTHRPLPSAHTLQGSAISKIIWHFRNGKGGVVKANLQTRLQAIAPDVVYCHKASALQPQIFQACNELSLPIVMHLHDYNAICPRTTMYKKGGNCASPCASCRLLTQHWRQHGAVVKNVISVSKFVQDRHQRHNAFPEANWHVVHNTDNSDLSDFSVKSAGPFTFGFIGALTTQKGLDDLVTAYAALPSEISAKLVIAGVGDPEYVDKLKAKFENNSIKWLGQVTPNAFYSQVDCVIVPSRWHEPQGLVIVESLRRGLRVIASDRGGITEVLAPRKGHLLYDPDIQGALGNAMCDMLKNKFMPDPEVLNPNFFERIEEVLETSSR